MKKILFTIPIDSAKQEELKQIPQTELIFLSRKEVTSEVLEDIDGVIGNVSVELLNHAPKLKWLHLESAGADKYAKTLNPNILLTNSTGAYGPAIAEHMIGGVFYFYKKIDQYAKAQAEHLWNNLGTVDCVGEANVLVVGYGDIGQSFASRMKALGCTITGVKRTSSQAPYCDELITMDQIDDALPKADIIALSLPSTPETYQIFNEKLLRCCKKEAVFINVGRGVTVDTDALMKVLDEGWFKGVMLDVVDPEPLPMNHPLWRYPNVLITPHVSGNYNMRATFDRVISMAKQNIQHFANNEPLINQVNRTTGYKESK